MRDPAALDKYRRKQRGEVLRYLFSHKSDLFDAAFSNYSVNPKLLDAILGDLSAHVALLDLANQHGRDFERVEDLVQAVQAARKATKSQRRELKRFIANPLECHLFLVDNSTDAVGAADDGNDGNSQGCSYAVSELELDALLASARSFTSLMARLRHLEEMGARYASFQELLAIVHK
jgi:hypothetical protein